MARRTNPTTSVRDSALAGQPGRHSIRNREGALTYALPGVTRNCYPRGKLGNSMTHDMNSVGNDTVCSTLSIGGMVYFVRGCVYNLAK